MRPTPRTTIAPMATGNSGCDRLVELPPPPARATRATFFAEDALPIRPPRLPPGRSDSRAGSLAPAASAGRHQRAEQLGVALGDVRRRRPGLHEATAGLAHRPRLVRMFDQVA